MVTDYEAGRGIPNNLILGKMERVLGIKLRGKERGQPMAPPGKKWDNAAASTAQGAPPPTRHDVIARQQQQQLQLQLQQQHQQQQQHKHQQQEAGWSTVSSRRK